MQIIPNQLGEAFSTGLNELAQHKLNNLTQQYERAQYVKALTPKVGGEMANFLASLSPEERKMVWPNVPFIQQPEQQEEMGGMEALNGAQQQEQIQPELNPQQQTLQALQQYFQNPTIGKQQQMGGLEALTGMQQQQAPGQQQQMPPRESKPVENLFTSPQEKRQREKLELQKQQIKSAEEERLFKHEQSLKPFLEKQHSEFKLARTVGNKAKKALNLLEKNKKHLPYRVVGVLPQQAQALLINHPGMREYAATINDIVKDTAGVEKGPLTKARISLTEAVKANFSQPYETQKAILEDLIDRSKNYSEQEKFLSNLKDKKTGYHPTDTQDRLIEFTQAQDYPLDYPQYYRDGTIIEENGKQYQNVGSTSWKELKR